MTTEQPATPTPAPKPAPEPAPAPKPAEPDAPDTKDVEFEVDEDMGTLGTKVGSLGWPEGAENEKPADDA